MPPKYKKLPKLNEWKEDSCGPMSRMFNHFCRSFKVDQPTKEQLKDDMEKDVTMEAIYNLLSFNELKVADAGEQLWLLFDLFLALKTWLKNRKSHNALLKLNALFRKKSSYLSGLLDIRAKAVEDLFGSICFMLANRLLCTVNTLPNKLDEYFGKSLTKEGWETDKSNHPEYMDKLIANKFRVIFIEKKAYMVPWWEDSSDLTTDTAIKLELGDTKHASEDTRFMTDFTMPNEAYCILDMNGQFYVAPHGSDTGGGRYTFHSSYLSGESVLCAGSVVITKGVFTFLSNKSGHYKPTPTHILHYLNALAIHGMAHDDITIHVCRGGDLKDMVFPTVSAYKKWLATDSSFLDRSTDIILSNVNERGTRKELGHYKHYRQLKSTKKFDL